MTGNDEEPKRKSEREATIFAKVRALSPRFTCDGGFSLSYNLGFSVYGFFITSVV
jgi:hypothetical protein